MNGVIVLKYIWPPLEITATLVSKSSVLPIDFEPISPNSTVPDVLSQHAYICAILTPVWPIVLHLIAYVQETLKEFPLIKLSNVKGPELDG